MKIILILSVFIFWNCNGPWITRENSDPVWCGPNKRVEIQTRQLNDLTERHSEHRWICNGKPLKSINWVVNDSIDYLEKIRVLNSWPTRGHYSGCGESFLPPNRLYLVSINPKVILLIGKRSEDDRPPLSGQILHDCRPDGALEFGTEFDCGPEILWFSPELEEGPTPLAGYDAQIKLPDGYLQLTQDGNRFRVERH